LTQAMEGCLEGGRIFEVGKKRTTRTSLQIKGGPRCSMNGVSIAVVKVLKKEKSREKTVTFMGFREEREVVAAGGRLKNLRCWGRGTTANQGSWGGKKRNSTRDMKLKLIFP